MYLLLEMKMLVASWDAVTMKLLWIVFESLKYREKARKPP